MRVEVGREIVLRLIVEDDDGRVTEADATPTVTVTDSAGATVTVGTVAVDEETSEYRATVEARDEVDRLDVTWTFAVASHTRTVRDEVVVVSERLVTLARMRQDAEMQDADGELLRRVQDEIEAWFASALKTPAVREFARTEFRLRYDSPEMRLPTVLAPTKVRRIAYVTSLTNQSQEVVLDPAAYSIVNGALVRVANDSFLTGLSSSASFVAGWYRIDVEHGLDSVPADLRRAAVALARHCARHSNYPDRARRVVTQETEIDFSLPSPDRPTGLPEVDAAIARHGEGPLF